MEYNKTDDRECLSLWKDETNHDDSANNDDTISHDNTINHDCTCVLSTKKYGKASECFKDDFLKNYTKLNRAIRKKS